MTLYAHLHTISPRDIERRSRGSLLLRFTGDLSRLRLWVSRGLARSVVAGIKVVGAISVIALANYRLALALTAVLMVGSLVSLGIGPRLQRLERGARRRRARIASNVAEQVGTSAVVRAFGRSAGEQNRLAQQNDALTRELVKSAAVRGLLRACLREPVGSH